MTAPRRTAPALLPLLPQLPLLLLTLVSCLPALAGCEDEAAKPDDGAKPAPTASAAPETAAAEPGVEEGRRAAERARTELARLGAPADLSSARRHFDVFAQGFRGELATRDLDAVRSNVISPAEIAGCQERVSKKASAPLEDGFAERHAKLMKDLDEIVGRGWRYLAVEVLPGGEVLEQTGKEARFFGEDCRIAFSAQTTFLVALDNNREPHALELRPVFVLVDGNWRLLGPRFSGDGLNCEAEGKGQAICATWERERTR